jgi:hypothetical protein
MSQPWFAAVTAPGLLRRAVLLGAGLLAAGSRAEPPTLDWRLPLPAGAGWRVVEWREGQGVRHEEYIPRDQGIEDYRDRLLVQRFADQGMSPDAYLGHIASGLASHCSPFTTSGLTSGERDGLPHATRTAYCGRFGERNYGYVLAQKAIRDGDHLFVVEREWRLPPSASMPTAWPASTSAPADEALKRDIRNTVRWLVEQVHPGVRRRRAARPAAALRPARRFHRPGFPGTIRVFLSACRRAPLPTRQDHLRQPEIRARPDDPLQRADRPAGLAGRYRRRFDEPAGARLRQALESLGPIFVKFGQMLSTRRDLLPPAIAEELARLQDRVPPFPTEEALAQLHAAYGKPVDEVFARFDREPVASASIAQVHFAQLPDGTEVAVKILRPGIAPVIAHDLALLDAAATVLERCGRKAAASSRGKSWPSSPSTCATSST